MRSIRWGSGMTGLSVIGFLILPLSTDFMGAGIPAFGGSGLLAQSQPVELDTLRVLGSRVSSELPQRTRAVEILDRDAIGALPARNLAEALRWAIGLELGARSPAQSDLSLRGAGFEQVLVLVNGVRMTDPQTGHFNLNLTVPLEHVERIEILRGPASALYGGDAVGGVVNVVTRSRLGWSGSLQAGSFGTVAGSLSGAVELGGGVGLRAGGEWARSDGHRSGTDYGIWQGGVEVGLPLAGGRLATELGLAERRFGADDFYGDFPSFEVTETATASVGWQPASEARVRVQPRVSWRRHDDDFILVREDPAIYRNVHRSSQRSAEVVIQGRPADAVSIAGGGEVGRDDLESSNLGNRNERRAGAFLEVGRDGLGPFATNAGIRLDHYETWGNFVSPSLSISFDLTPELRSRASVGRAFRGPTWTERYYSDPAHAARSDLDPERSTSWEIGVDLHTRPGATASVSAFHRLSRDLIDWARPTGSLDEHGIWETRNVNEARFRGIEAETTLPIGDRTRVRATGSILSVSSDAVAGLESKYALRPMSEQFALEVRQLLPRDVDLSIRGLRGRRVADAAFLQVDLRLGVPMLDGTFFLDVVNLGGSGHMDLVGHPVAGRALYLGYRMGG